MQQDIAFRSDHQTAQTVPEPEEPQPSSVELQVLPRHAHLRMAMAHMCHLTKLAFWAVQEAEALLAQGKHAEARLALLRFLESQDEDVRLHLVLVRACLALGCSHSTEAVEHARSGSMDPS